MGTDFPASHGLSTKEQTLPRSAQKKYAVYDIFVMKCILIPSCLRHQSTIPELKEQITGSPIWWLSGKKHRFHPEFARKPMQFGCSNPTFSLVRDIKSLFLLNLLVHPVHPLQWGQSKTPMIPPAQSPLPHALYTARCGPLYPAGSRRMWQHVCQQLSRIGWLNRKYLKTMGGK